MKKFLSVALVVTMCMALGVTALATDVEDDVTNEDGVIAISLFEDDAVEVTAGEIEVSEEAVPSVSVFSVDIFLSGA